MGPAEQFIAILLFSLALNLLLVIATAVLVWFNRKLVGKLNLAGQVSTQFFTYLAAFREHINTLMKQELYMKDPQLERLLEHAREVETFLEATNEIYSFLQPDLEEYLDVIFNEEEEADEDDGTEEPDQEEKKEERKTVFHSSSRRRDN